MIKKWLKHIVLKESIKEIELDKILDKISEGKDLTKRETDFLELYNQTQDNDYKDYSFLSRSLVCTKIEEYLGKHKKIYCDLCDRDGKIGQLIIEIKKNDYNLILKHGNHTLDDRYLYNISYDMDKDEYSLTSQDEYFEELLV